ncbi:MAG: amidohydrolase [Flavobacteriales bacterium]|nr:amidohydrolase [Flavobacteriales bacterium]
MKNELNLLLVQTELYWEDREKNLEHFTSLLEQRKNEKFDLIILPEMFSTGFSMEPANISETMDGKVIEWMKDLSAEYGTALCGSLIIVENEKHYNRFIFCKPDGEINYYDKRHLFSYAGEERNFYAGKQQTSIYYEGWKINPFICYDLRFPVWSYNISEADLLIYVANWPERRIAHWTALLPARAIENQCYVAGVNRVGTDANHHSYTGCSAVYDPMGENLAQLGNGEEVVLVKIYKEKVLETRKKLPFIKDADTFEILT